MKKLIVLTVLLAFVVGSPVTVLANGSEIKNASQYCKANNDLGFSNHGKCVSLLMAQDGPVKICKEMLNTNPGEFYETYNNLGGCISHIRLGYDPE